MKLATLIKLISLLTLIFYALHPSSVLGAHPSTGSTTDPFSPDFFAPPGPGTTSPAPDSNRPPPEEKEKIQDQQPAASLPSNNDTILIQKLFEDATYEGFDSSQNNE